MQEIWVFSNYYFHKFHPSIRVDNDTNTNYIHLCKQENCDYILWKLFEAS